MKDHEELRHELLSSVVPGGMMGGYFEPGFPFYFINKQMLTYLGYDTEAEFVLAIEGSIDNCMHPDDRKRVSQQVEKELAVKNEYQVEYRMAKKDGSYIWVHDVGTLSKDENGRQTVISVCYDISNRLEMQRQIQELVDNIPGGIGLYRWEKENLKPIFVNKAFFQLFGIDEFKMEKDSTSVNYQLVHPDDLAGLKQYHKEISLKKEANTAFSYRIWNKRKNEYIWISAHSNCVVGMDGIPQIYIIYTDITAEKEREKLLEALEEAESATKATTEFLSRMSHDMRTSMNTIIGLTALSLDEKNLSSTLKENLSNIQGAGNFLLGLVNDILDMSKIEAGAVNIKREPYYYADFQTKLKSMFVPQCRAKNITFIFDDLTISSCVLTDKLRLDQIFFNILSNAVKFTPENGTITYKRANLAIDDKHVAADYIITDTGIGMTEEFLEHVFQPFVQEDNSYSSELKGSGLGLSIAKNLTELMGGTFKIESKKNIGTKVTVHLEFELCRTQPLLSENAKESALNVVDALRGKHVLLVEDHPLNAKIATKLMEKKGIIVSWAKNGKEAVNTFANAAKDCYAAVLMDIRMPVMDGLSATKAIRNLDRADAKKVPIIAMSANAYVEDVEKSLQAGMDAHLAKPVEPNKLYEALIKYCC